METFNPVGKATDLEAVRILEVDIGNRLPAVSAIDVETGQSYPRANSLVRLHTQPLGVVGMSIDENGLNAAEYAHQIWIALWPAINEHLRSDGLPEMVELEADGISYADKPKCLQDRADLLAKAPRVSVIVATRDRPERLAACLGSLVSMDYPSYEIIVVDNAPSTSATADFVRQKYGNLDRVRYAREDRPGLACAHNRGLMEVRTPIVAFTDDDVIVDNHWLAELVGGFSAGKNVGCVTGMILAAELETPAQTLFDQVANLGKGFSWRIFDLHENRDKSRLYPFAAGIFGSGANMAFKTSVIRDIGGFDLALGTGSGALGGDDLAAFFRVISEGFRLVYEPAAIVHHRHPRDSAGLRRQMFAYGAGLTAYLTKTLIDRPRLLADFAIRIPYGLAYALSARSTKNLRKPSNYPRDLTNIERIGMLYGPFAYLLSRWKRRKWRRHTGPPVEPTATSRPKRPRTHEVPPS